MVLLYRSPIPVRRGVGYFTCSKDFYLPSWCLEEGGGGGQHPVPFPLCFGQSFPAPADRSERKDQIRQPENGGLFLYMCSHFSVVSRFIPYVTLRFQSSFVTTKEVNKEQPSYINLSATATRVPHRVGNGISFRKNSAE